MLLARSIALSIVAALSVSVASAQQLYTRQQGPATAGHYPCFVADFVVKDCAPLAVNAYTVSTLPSGTVGDIAYITDGDSGLAWGATAVNSGSGATKYLLWYNGVHWTVAGK